MKKWKTTLETECILKVQVTGVSMHPHHAQMKICVPGIFLEHERNYHLLLGLKTPLKKHGNEKEEKMISKLY